MENVLEKNYLATISDVGFNFKLSLPSLLKDFQFLATEHSKIMGMSYFDLKEKDNAFWVLSKVKVKFLCDLPMWGDEYKLLTFPTEPTNVKYGRNFKLFNSCNKLAVVGSTDWCILDRETRRLRRVSSISCCPENFAYLTERLESENYTLINDSVDAGAEFIYEKTVRCTDLDMNLHMNNVVYTKIVLDCFSSGFFNSKIIDEYELHFIKEAPEGSKIEVYKKDNGGSFVIFGKSEDGSQSYFKARIKFCSLNSK